MNIPGFTAETSVYRTATKYRRNTGGTELTGQVRPALFRPPASVCLRACCDSGGCDDGCLQCCLCVSRGGRPNECCF
jgi:hypothetical protein